MSGETSSRTVHGIEAPAAGTWEIDPGHTSLAFVARYLMVTKVRGHFSEFSGAIRVAERPEGSSAELIIGASSIDTGNEDLIESPRDVIRGVAADEGRAVPAAVPAVRSSERSRRRGA